MDHQQFTLPVNGAIETMKPAAPAEVTEARIRSRLLALLQDSYYLDLTKTSNSIPRPLFNEACVLLPSSRPFLNLFRGGELRLSPQLMGIKVA